MDNRFVIEKESELISPGENIICHDCKYRDKTLSTGYKKCICDKFNDVYSNAKPDDILFENAGCKFYKKESE